MCLSWNEHMHNDSLESLLFSILSNHDILRDTKSWSNQRLQKHITVSHIISPTLLRCHNIICCAFVSVLSFDWVHSVHSFIGFISDPNRAFVVNLCIMKILETTVTIMLLFFTIPFDNTDAQVCKNLLVCEIITSLDLHF